MSPPGKIAQDLALRRELEEAIPALEEKLRAMKVTRQRLLSAERMRKMRQDKAFNAVMLAAVHCRLERPEVREHFMRVRYTGRGGPLPFAKGTPARKLYDKFRLSGFSRELAIEKINAEATA